MNLAAKRPARGATQVVGVKWGRPWATRSNATNSHGRRSTHRDLLDILYLLAELFDQHLHVHGGARGFQVL
jgi:hypothetical protein